jgi:hypothetical protein
MVSDVSIEEVSLIISQKYDIKGFFTTICFLMNGILAFE